MNRHGELFIYFFAFCTCLPFIDTVSLCSKTPDARYLLKLPSIGSRRGNSLLGVALVDSNTLVKQQSSEMPVMAEDGRPKARVLIVEDSLPIVKVLSKWLEKNDCIVSCAPNGKIGLSMMKESQYDLMLLDFLMV